MIVGQQLQELIGKSVDLAASLGHGYLTPEHLLYTLCGEDYFIDILEDVGGDVKELKQDLNNYFLHHLEVQESVEEIVQSYFIQEILLGASEQAFNSSKEVLEIAHIVGALMTLEQCYATYYLEKQGITKRDLLYAFSHQEGEEIGLESDEENRDLENDEKEQEHSGGKDKSYLEKYVTHLNTVVEQENQPLVVRQDIIQRTIEVLCRKTKNNPIHLGEPGVGKSAIINLLTKAINNHQVPPQLAGVDVFSLDLGSMLAGTQYRGDFEKRIKKVLRLISCYDKPLVYIDEIHNLVGAGALGQGSLDASNLLKPYLLQEKIRFIGATTYEEYKKYFEKDKGLVRRFQQIEVSEPTKEECLDILKGVKDSYEKYHGVTYTEKALEAAISLSVHYMNERYLPDKALDVIDEAGVYVGLSKNKKKIVSEEIIQKVVSKMCHIPEMNVKTDELTKLKQLDKYLKQRIFHQDHVIDKIVQTIKVARCGLDDGNKPLANMLFVGPTGVGKTEVAKCLADALDVKFIRFDMSEYSEKHSVSKFIGAPPGYVGYDEGGLLTDIIRKTPHAVLLLDEIEKAHSDLFNILLQVMDYGMLTDNHGKKADFRNVIIIMTSNAGAREVGRTLVGFGDRRIQNENMSQEIDKVFSPEFRNRLSAKLVFNGLNEEMAYLIAKKTLEELKDKLKVKNIILTYSKKTITHIAVMGTTAVYGARAIKRIVEDQVKPLIVEEMLFGEMKNGGKCQLKVEEGQYKVQCIKKDSN